MQSFFKILLVPFLLLFLPIEEEVEIKCLLEIMDYRGEGAYFVISVLDKEENDKKDKEFNKKFNRVPEFSDGPREVPDTVRIVAVGSALTGLLFLDGQTSIYAYPTGEKDGGIVILSNQKEIVAVTFAPFLLGFDKIRKYLDPETSLDDLPEEQDKMAKEMFESWIKK